MPDYVNVIIEYLNHHLLIAFVFTFFIAMIESIAILGTIIPGMLTMTIIGMLVGSGILPASPTILISILGALTGDFLSYWFGIRYRNHIYQMWPFNKYKKILELGEKFFAKHGGKSVVIGRFVGPVRSMVPLIAGLLQMRPLPFSIAAFISATAWTLIYIFPGVFLGALSMELPKWKALEFLGLALLWIFVAWVTIWLVQLLVRKSWKYIDTFLEICWIYLKEHPKASNLLQLIVNPKDPHDHRQFALLFLSLLSLFIFIIIAHSVYAHGWVTQLDLPIFYLLQSFRTNFLDYVLTSISFLGDYRSLLLASGIIFLVLLYRRAFWAALHWGGLTIVILMTTLFSKWLIHAKRPELYLKSDIFSSFPSNHVSLSFALFGFTAILIATELTGKWRKLPAVIAGIIVFLIALSRIYLGVHWFSDIVGAFFLSSFFVLLFTVSYRRRLNHFLSARFLMILLPTTLIVCCFFNGVFNRNKITKTHRLHIATYSISKQNWWENQFNLPFYRNNRFGKPMQPFNISWLGDINKIRKQLLEKGWKNEQEESTDFKTKFLKNLIKSKEDFKLPMLPTLYHDRSPSLVMTNKIGKNLIILELWHSDVHITKSNSTLWIGTIYTRHYPHKWYEYSIKPNFKDAIQPLLLHTQNSRFKLMKIPIYQLPKRLQNIINDSYFSIVRIDDTFMAETP